MVRDDLCYQNLPVTIVGIGGGVTYSTLGATHHAQEDVAIARSVPNHVGDRALRSRRRPRPPRAGARRRSAARSICGSARPANRISRRTRRSPWIFGKLRRLRAGGDVCIVAYGGIMKRAFEVAERLEAAGKRTAIVSAHTLKPLDASGLAAILDAFPMVVVIEECAPVGGLSSQVKEIAWDTGAQTKIRTFALRDEFIHCYGSHDDLLDAHGLSVAHMSARILDA